MYSALAAPFLLVARWAGAHELSAFTWANVALLAIAARFAAGRFRPATLVFLFLGPILWWVDKAHTEVFAYSILVVIVSQHTARPAVSVLAGGLLAAQHPQALLFFAGVWTWMVRRSIARVTDARLPAAAALASLACALSYGGYYLWRIGRWTPLPESGDLRIPAVRTAGAILWDLNIGIASGAPLAALTVLACIGLALRRGAGRYRAEWLWIAASAPLLFAFAQTMNVNHGGTPGMSRYALWLIPLAAPLVDAALRSTTGAPRLTLVGLVCASAAWNAVAFAPWQPDGSLQPTAIARYQWLHHPDLLDPLPEIFAERTRHQDSVNVFAATETCSKALLQGGLWPQPCDPATAPVPVECQADGALCYANRTSHGYVFHATSRRGGISLRLPHSSTP